MTPAEIELLRQELALLRRELAKARENHKYLMNLAYEDRQQLQALVDQLREENAKLRLAVAVQDPDAVL